MRERIFSFYLQHGIVMRISSLFEWGAVILVFAIAGFLFLNMGFFVAPDLPFPAPASADSSYASANCSELGYGGFYQEPLPASAPRSIPRQANEWACTINPLYKYTMIGKVVGKDEYLPVGPDLLSPMDLTIANGDVINPEYASRFSFVKTHRQYTFVYRPPPDPQPISFQYIVEHTSNNHLLFADESVHAMARSLKIGDFVRVSGYLVTISGSTPDERRSFQGTSTTRSDRGEDSCEVVYVESLEKLRC
jgi:hypothetical protein